MFLYVLVLSTIIINTKANPPTFHTILKSQLKKYHFLGDYDSCRYVYKEYLNNKTYYTTDIEQLIEISVFMQDTVNAINLFKELLMKTGNDTAILSQKPQINILKTYPQYKQIEQEYESMKLYYYKNFNLDISQQILEMYVKDRFIRTELADSCVSVIMEKIDNKNFNTIKGIVTDFGFPTLSQIGVEAWKGLYILLLHSSTLSEQNFQYVDSLMRKQVDLYILEPWRYANMVDRFFHFNGIPQKYGTCVIFNNDMSKTCGDIFEPENLDRRRYEIGLPPFASYAKAMNFQKIPDTYKYIDPLQYYFENK